jgi:hypothetical protein
VDSTGFHWIPLDFTIYWTYTGLSVILNTKLDWTGLDWTGLPTVSNTKLDSTGLSTVSNTKLDWTGLHWTANTKLDWTGLHWTVNCILTQNWTPLDSPRLSAILSAKLD